MSHDWEIIKGYNPTTCWQYDYTLVPQFRVCKKCGYSAGVGEIFPDVCSKSFRTQDIDLDSFEILTDSRIYSAQKPITNWFEQAQKHRFLLDICAGKINPIEKGLVYLCKYCASDIVKELQNDLNFETLQYRTLKDCKKDIPDMRSKTLESKAEWKRINDLYKAITRGTLVIDKCLACVKNKNFSNKNINK